MKFLPKIYFFPIVVLIVIAFLWWNIFPVYAGISVNVCHATGSSSNPYNQVAISVNSAADCTDAKGHDSHSSDIIPIFTYETCTYPGKNWTAANQAIWNNNCNPVPTPTPTSPPAPTATPTPTSDPTPTTAPTPTSPPGTTPTPTPTTMPSCGNGVCEASLSESCSVCATDCGACANPTATPTPTSTSSSSTSTSTSVPTPTPIPAEAPRVTLDPLEENPTASESVKVAGTATSRYSSIVRVEISIDGGVTWAEADFTAPNFGLELGKLEDGNYPILARAFDALGDVGQAGPLILIIDRLRPIIGGNIVAFGPQIIYPLQDGTIPSVAGVKTSIVISMRGGVTEAVIRMNEKDFPLRHLLGTDLWEGSIGLDEQGIAELKAIAKDGAGHREERTLNTYSAQDFGIVHDSSTNQPVKDAVVTLYVFDEITKSWFIWDSKSYGQNNSQVTNAQGQYSFLVPSGKYYLEVKRLGYQIAFSEITEVLENAVLNPPISLTPFAQLGLSLGYFIPDTYPMQINEVQGLGLEREKIGRDIPSFSFTQTNGIKFTKENLANKNHVLVFFSPWSALSIEGISQLSGSFRELSSDTEVIGVSVQESAFATDTFLKRGLYDFTAVADYDGKYSSDIGVTTLPYYVFVDSKGKIKETFTGVLTKEDLLKKISNMP